MKNPLIFVISVLLIFGSSIGQINAQTRAGALILDLNIDLSRKDTESDRFEGTSVNLSIGGSYNLTNRIFFYAGGGAAKSFGATDTYYYVGTGLGYLFNTNPGIQKMIPRVAAFVDGRFEGDSTIMVVTGLIGFRYHINKSVGLSNSFYFDKSFTNDSFDLRFYSFGISSSFFFQFGAD